MRSFMAVSEAMGLSIYSQKQTPEQLARLQRVHEIRNELGKLNYSHLQTQTPNPKTP